MAKQLPEKLKNFPNLFPNSPQLPHLARALAKLSHSNIPIPEDPEGNHFTQALIQKIGEADHYLFLLIDGLGAHLIDKMPEDSFLRQTKFLPIYSTFPSGTTAALTTLTTGEWPVRHGTVGWNAYLPQVDLNCQSLLFVERFSEACLSKHKLLFRDVFPLKNIHTSSDFSHNYFFPDSFIGSAFSTYRAGAGALFGYSQFEDASKQMIDFLLSQRTPSFTNFFFPNIDACFHSEGSSGKNMLPNLLALDSFIQNVVINCHQKVKILVSADHGLIDCPDPTKHFVISEKDPLSTYLRAPPSGEARVPFFHVKKGSEKAFTALFHDIFSNDFELLSIQEASEYKIFGPYDMEKTVQERLGDFLAIPKTLSVIRYQGRGEMPKDHIGNHGGLTDQEMQIPLYIF